MSVVSWQERLAMRCLALLTLVSNSVGLSLARKSMFGILWSKGHSPG